MVNVRPAERGRTFVLFLQYFFVVAFTITAKSARDTFFLSRHDVSVLPLLFAASAAAVAGTAALYSRLAARLAPATLFNGMNLLFLICLVLVPFRLYGFVIPLLYVLVETLIALLSLSFWLAAAEIFDPRQAKRLFGIIGGGGALAAILAGLAAKPFAQAFGPESLLWLAAAALAAQWVLGAHAFRYHTIPALTAAPARTRQAAGRFDSYLTTIAVVVAVSAVASQIIDYQFKIFAAGAIPGEVALAGFFGDFYAATGAATLLVQFFFTSALLTRFGLLAGLLTLPVFLNLSAFALLLRPGLAGATIGKFFDQTLRFTLNNSALELLWLPVPSLRRKSVRPVISGTVKYLAESSAGICTFLLAGLVGPRYLSLLSVAALVVWTAAAVRLKSLYVNALVSALEKRQVDFEDLVLDVQDPSFVAIIEKTLDSGDEAHQLSALEMIDGLPLDPWSPTLGRSFDRGSSAIRQKILQLAVAEPEILSNARVLESLSGPGPVAVEAIRNVAARGLAIADPMLRSLAQNATPEVRAAAAAVLLDRGESDRELASSLLSRLLADSDPRARAAALGRLVDRTDLLPASLLSDRLRDPSREVREAALQVAARRADESSIDGVLACLDDPRTASSAYEALKPFPAEQAIAHLDRGLHAHEATHRRKLGILRALAAFPTALAAPLLIDSIGAHELDLSAQAVRSLLLLARDHPLPAACLERIPQVTSAMLRSAYQCNRLLKLLGSGSSDTLLCDDLADRIRQIMPIILGLETVTSRNRSLTDAAAIAGDGDPAKLPLLLELLDNVLAPEKRVFITPLLEPLTAGERDIAGARLYSDLPVRPEPELHRAVYSGREWESAIAVDYLWRTGYGEFLAAVDWEQVQDTRLTREARAAAQNQLPGMYSVLEKTILLKSVGLFAEIPAEKLSKIAQIAQETRLLKGEALMREGDFGDSLFIVADGAVRVHKSGLDLAVLKKGDCVGEMALLDHAPRSADVTVEEDSALLRIAREDFHEVTEANPEIMQAVVRLLVRRLREANDKLAVRVS